MESIARKITLPLATALLATMSSAQSFADNGNAATNVVVQQANISAPVMVVGGGGPSFLMIVGLIFR